jgi:hypothetical protein
MGGGEGISVPITGKQGPLLVDFGRGVYYIYNGVPFDNGNRPTFAPESPHLVRILGNFTTFGKWNPWDRIINIESWGNNYLLTDVSELGSHSLHLRSVPSNIPSTVTTTNNMFRNTLVFDQDLSGWDVSNITDMAGMFASAAGLYTNGLFKYDLKGWNVSGVTQKFRFFSPDGLTDTTLTDPNSPFTFLPPILSGTVINGSALLQWSVQNNGTMITGYDVSCTPAAIITITDLSAICIGLRRGTVYTFTVTANSADRQSAPSNVVTLTSTSNDIPDMTSTVHPGETTLTWSLPDINPLTITGYNITSSPTMAFEVEPVNTVIT